MLTGPGRMVDVASRSKSAGVPTRSTTTLFDLVMDDPKIFREQSRCRWIGFVSSLFAIGMQVLRNWNASGMQVNIPCLGIVVPSVLRQVTLTCPTMEPASQRQSLTAPRRGLINVSIARRLSITRQH